MSLTYEQAVDDMMAMLKAAWDPTGHKMFYESVDADRETDNTAFAMALIRHASGQQQTLGAAGGRTFVRRGIIIVQIFTRIGNGLRESYQLAKVVADGFEGESSENGVWFRNVRINEIGKDGMFIQTNVNIEFEYTELK